MNTSNAKFSGTLAMFDLDQTLIKPKINKTAIRPYTEFVYLSPNVINKLIEFNNNGYQLVIISNQKVLKKDSERQDWIKKINKIYSDLTENVKCELIVFASLLDDKYRKPRSGVLEFIQPNNLSFYCGDALARPSDFSECDIKFAINIGVKCYSPEYIWNGVAIDNDTIYINYPILKNLLYYKAFQYPLTGLQTDNNKEMILMVGLQASGKSLLAKWIKKQNANKPYEIVSLDIEKTIQKCIKKTENLCMGWYNIILDNTNPTQEARKRFIDIAKKYNYIVKVIEIQYSFEHSMHNNYYRSIKHNLPLVPNVALYKYIKYYEVPNKDEGIDEIIKLPPIRPTLNLDYNEYLF